MDISIRRARAGDLGRILKLEREGFGRHAWPRDLILEYLEMCGDLFLVAESKDRLAAYLIVCTRPPRAELVSIAVDTRDRRLGVGAALLRSAIRRLRRRGLERLSLMVKVTNEGAIAFYARTGFRRVRRVRAYYEDGRDAWLMSFAL